MTEGTRQLCIEKALRDVAEYLLRCEVVIFQNFLNGISVKELLFEAVVIDLHIVSTVETCYLFAKAAAEYAVFKSYDL